MCNCVRVCMRACACMFVNACGVACVYKLRGREWGGCGASCIQMRQTPEEKQNKVTDSLHGNCNNGG